MTFFERVVSVVGERAMLRALRFYPPYLGAGVRVREAAADLSAIEVEMKLHPWNQLQSQKLHRRILARRRPAGWRIKL